MYSEPEIVLLCSRLYLTLQILLIVYINTYDKDKEKTWKIGENTLNNT
jgi:hypothetical protein